MPPRSTGWLSLHRHPRINRYSWVISIPKKVISTSVRRSRLRRLIREAMRQSGATPSEKEAWRFSVKADPVKTIGMTEVKAIIMKLVELNKC